MVGLSSLASTGSTKMHKRQEKGVEEEGKREEGERREKGRKREMYEAKY